MADLLIHSLAEFDDLILGALNLARAKRVVEIGSESGRMTERLLAHATQVGGELISIDPSPAAEAARRLDEHPRATLVRAPSLDVLRDLPSDAYLIDGDHNYYTVLNESAALWDAVRRDDRHLLVFYHDVAWPWARRDLYYDPTRIPAEYLKPHTWDHGVRLGEPGVVDGGFRGAGHWACAIEEGGPCNGVLTAIEDFVVGKEADLAWAQIPAVFGLGVLFDRHAPFAAALTAWLEPFHQNPLLERLERNRLECYLRVIELQDGHHAVAA